jgi:hypothetical protein
LDQNSNENIVRISALSFFGLYGDLVRNIINKEAYRNPKKLQGRPKEAIKTFRAEILTIFPVLFWSKQ